MQSLDEAPELDMQRTEGRTDENRGLGSHLSTVVATNETENRRGPGASTGFRYGIVHVGDINSSQDILEAGATSLEVRALHRMKLLAIKVESFCQSSHVQRAWSVVFAFLLAWVVGKTAASVIPGLQNEVGAFLRSVDLGQYSGRFAEKGYVSLRDMLLVTDEDLRDYVGITTVPHRRRILNYSEQIRKQRAILPVLFWFSITTLVAVSIMLGLAMLVSSEIRDRVVCVTMFWGFMSWYRMRLWQRLWRTLDVSRSPRIIPKVCEPPTVVEPRRTFSSNSGIFSPNRIESRQLANRIVSADADPGFRNSNNRLLGRLKRRRNRS